MLQWQQYAGAWSAADQPVTIAFPSQDPAAPNVQACCESEAMDSEINVGCLEDCARAACNLAIEKLQEKLDAGPPAGCAGDCPHRFEQTLTTWMAYIEANYDLCLVAAEDGTLPFSLADPPSASDPFPWGAGRSAVLTIDCTIDETLPPIDTEQTCETGHNEPSEAAWEEWVCPQLVGEVELSSPQGREKVPLRGHVVVRRGLCAAEPCWLELDRLELETTASPASAPPGLLSNTMRGSLAYPAFGLATTDQATLGVGMLGLHVVLAADPLAADPLASLSLPVAFTMANSQPAQLELAAGRFELAPATFAWVDHEVMITASAARCHCTSCPPAI